MRAFYHAYPEWIIKPGQDADEWLRLVTPPYEAYRDFLAQRPILEMEGILEETVKHHVAKGSLSFANLVRLTMHCVELAAQHKPLDGESKLEMCKKLMPDFVYAAVKYGAITAMQGANLIATLTEGMDLAEDIIETLVAVSKHPAFIQVQAAVEEATTKCCRKRSRAGDQTK